MEGLIQKSGYIKSGSGGGHYAEYIATREGAEELKPGGYLEYIAERPPGPTDCSPPIVPPTWRKLRMRSMGRVAGSSTAIRGRKSIPKKLRASVLEDEQRQRKKRG